MNIYIYSCWINGKKEVRWEWKGIVCSERMYRGLLLLGNEIKRGINMDSPKGNHLRVSFVQPIRYY